MKNQKTMRAPYLAVAGLLVLSVGAFLLFFAFSPNNSAEREESETYSAFGKLEDAEFLEQYCQERSISPDCRDADEDQNQLCLRCLAIQEREGSLPKENKVNVLKPFVQKELSPDIEQAQEQSYGAIKYQKEPLLLQGSEVLVIDNTHFIIENSVELRDQSRIVILNSLLEFKNDYAHQNILEAYDQSEIVVENSLLRSDKPMNWDFRGQSRLSLIGTQKMGTDDTWPWMTFSGDTSAFVRGSKFDATVWDRGNLSVEDSLVFIELVFENNSIVDERLNADGSNLIFPGDNEQGIFYNVSVKNSTIRGWGITVKTGSSITIRDGYRVVSTVQIGWPWTGKTVVLDNLEQKVYKDKTWVIEDSTLRLVNTDVWLWSPGAFMDNTLIMRNSILSDLAFGGDESVTIVENSKIYFVRARDNQKFEIRNSSIESDVVATGNSVVTLVNTPVGGKLVEQDNGKIVVQ